MKKYLTISLSIIVIGLFVLISSRSASAQAYVFNDNLTIGSSGPNVTQLQTWLINNGYPIPAISSGLANKGYFGSQTRLAVAAYQRTINLPPFGFWGPLTRQHVNGLGGYPGNSLTLVSPNGGESWQINSTHNITWTSPVYFRATYADLKLVPYYQPCTGQICPMGAASMMYPYRAPYTIANNISINQNSYSWRVGDFVDSVTYLSNAGILAPVPDGQYTIQICETGSTSNCDSSNSPFTIYTSGPSNDRAPVINGIDAPTTLSVGQTGTWSVRAYDPNNGTLSYSVIWGDENQAYPVYSGAMASPVYLQNTTFTHSYANAGTYTVTFTVRNSYGQSVQSTATVQVGNTNTAGPLQIISPNGGEYWSLGSTQTIRWTSPYYFRATYADLKLVPYYQPCTGQICPMGAASMMYPYRAPYTIANNISINQNSYSWRVGDFVDSVTYLSNAGILAPVPAGQYTIQICEVSSSNCESSDAPFTII